MKDAPEHPAIAEQRSQHACGSAAGSFRWPGTCLPLSNPVSFWNVHLPGSDDVIGAFLPVSGNTRSEASWVGCIFSTTLRRCHRRPCCVWAKGTLFCCRFGHLPTGLPAAPTFVDTKERRVKGTVRLVNVCVCLKETTKYRHYSVEGAVLKRL